MADHRPTLIRAPPEDPTKSLVENCLELTELGIIAPDLFTNTRELWHPPGARGIYGGAVIAQTLAAAQRTVPPDFVVHSFHCYFVLAGDSSTPILYHVERVREGRSFCTRTVQARQRGKAIFTVTMSFTKEDSGGPEQVRHAVPMPEDVSPPPEDYEEDLPGGITSPFDTYRMQITDRDGPPERKKTCHWVRAKGKISESGGHQAHLSALAYVSDSYFIGTVSRIHQLWRFPFRFEEMENLPEEVRGHVTKLNDWEGLGDLESMRGRPQVGMMVSLDHTIYFHNPKKVRADEWMYTEMDSPWSGDGRGVVTQRIFSKDGTLLATCFQEGVVRLKQEPAAKL
ncbi:acyl-CoA thioesterase II [Pseudomassariella vexata]|uniref:Acyl-CoA thioesterase II n=1 Tax=Pseudomassariella vexata TaxID=1141098 RepID=A0A1Y2DMX7_9PEZI|nr:acyl-CoA thioesterase II [Pseudomassariella vexata]ORY60597.1 acyl-CoA thioesterase II [Pseudomassariella vexata]